MAMIEVAGLWRPKQQSETVVASGPCGRNARYLILRNKSDDPRAPQFRLMIADNERNDKRKDDNKRDDKRGRDDDDAPF